MADSESESGYKAGPGRPPLHTRFKFGGCSALSPVAGVGPATHAFFSPIAHLGQNVGGRNRSGHGGRRLRATKMLLDMMKDVEHKAGDIAPPPEPCRLAAADKEVVQLFVARLR